MFGPPLVPPARPNGPTRSRSPRTTSSVSPVARKLRQMPKPPRNSPSPHESTTASVLV